MNPTADGAAGTSACGLRAWVPPRLVPLISSARAGSVNTVGADIDAFYASGYPKGYS